MNYFPNGQSESLSCAYPIVRETIPQSSLGYNTNNVYAGFPPKTNDGRNVVASNQPEADLNNNLIRQANIKSNWEYRRYLTENAVDVMKQNFRDSCNDVGYFQRFTPESVVSLNTSNNNITTPPHLYSSYLDESKPIGDSISDLKNTYLTREQLNSRKVSPSITQAELFNRMANPLPNTR